MVFETLRWIVTQRPTWVTAAWLLLTLVVFLTAPDLSRLAAEGQANLLPDDVESARAAEVVKRAWPDVAYDSMAVVALQREEGLTDTDHQYAARLANAFTSSDRPGNILRVLGPAAPEPIAQRLISRDRTMQLILVALDTAFVAPASHETLGWLQAQAASLPPPPPGLNVLWTGDAVLGRDYMDSVQTSLDRAAYVTVSLLLIVLLIVYRSLIVALIPILTIGLSILIARGILAWMATAGWEVSPLVELFLLVVMFGSGTDFCLYVSWRFSENWNARNPAMAMRVTLRRAMVTLATSAATVIVGLTLMGTTRFKLFSSTGPSVAIGLALTLVAALTLTPALLVLLARYRPRSFAGLTAPSLGFWDAIGHGVLARPFPTWLITVVVMLPAAVVGLRSQFIQDLLTELPTATPSARNLELVAEKFGQGAVAPLTVVIHSPHHNLRDSTGIALIDDASRLMTRMPQLAEVRSATQPLGDPEPLEPARLASRLAEVNEGFTRMAEGARQLQEGLTEGAGRLRAAMLLEQYTGLNLTGPLPGLTPNLNLGTRDDEPTPPAETTTRNRDAPDPSDLEAGMERARELTRMLPRDPVTSGLRQATGALLSAARRAPTRPEPSPDSESEPESEPDQQPDDAGTEAEAEADTSTTPTDPRELMVRELTRAADGASQIAEGALRAHHEVTAILTDPVGRSALDRLLITPETVREHPELQQSFDAYISPDGHLARFDLTQTDRLFSADAMNEVKVLRRRLNEFLGDVGASARATGANAEAADIWDLTRIDQYQTWIVVPLGVFIVLLITLRDVGACVNLIATMVFNYAFALGITHLVFVTWLGAEGLDWKVPYFLFVLLVAVGVDYNVFLIARMNEEAQALGLRTGIIRAIAQTGGLITSAAAITACSFASFLFSPLGSIRQLGFALVLGIVIDAVLIRPVLFPCGQWLLNRHRERRRPKPLALPALSPLVRVPD